MKFLPALFTAIVWGSTFVVSRGILDKGVDPIVLMAFRFVLAYVMLWIIWPHGYAVKSVREEFRFAMIGICGAALYFLFEYNALRNTTAVNVGLITSTVPIATAAIQFVLWRIKPSRKWLLGSVLAFGGAALVICAPVIVGSETLRVNLLGDSLAVGSVLMWAIYSVLLTRVDERVSTLVTSRRLFFYALLFIVPFCVGVADRHQLDQLLEPENIAGAIYLGGVASGLCMWLWNCSINVIGVARTNSFMYLFPLIGLAAAGVYDAGSINASNAVGAVMIFAGILLGRRG